MLTDSALSGAVCACTDAEASQMKEQNEEQRLAGVEGLEVHGKSQVASDAQ